MGFATSFLAGAQLAQREEDRRQRLLTSLLNRRPVGQGVAVARGGGGGGGDALSRIREVERLREAEADREAARQHQEAMRAEELEQARTASAYGRGALGQAGIAQPGVYTRTGEAPLTDEQFRQQQLAEAQAAQAQAAQQELMIPATQAAELAGRAGVEAGVRGIRDQKRETARRNFMDAYASRDVDAMQRHWKGMYPGAGFAAKFKSGPQGSIMIQWPGQDDWELYDEGTFRQTAIYGANQMLESPIGAQPGAGGGITPQAYQALAGAAAPAVGAAGAAQPTGRAAAAGTSKMPSWKEIQDVAGSRARIRNNAFQIAHEIAEAQNPMTDEMGLALKGEELAAAKQSYQETFNQVLSQLGQNKNLRDIGIDRPNKGLTRRQISQATNQASEQWNRYTKSGANRMDAAGNVITPENYFDTLWNQVSPKVAVGWAKENAPELIEARTAPQLTTEALMQQAGVVRTGEFPEVPEGAQPRFPGLVEQPAAARPGQVSPEQIERARPQPGQVRPVTTPAGPLNIGGMGLAAAQDEAGNPQIFWTDPNTGLPTERVNTMEDLRPIADYAKGAPPEEKPVINALLISLIRELRRRRAAAMDVPGM